MSTPITELLSQLQKSRFRASFHLRQDDIDYINQKGWEVIRAHGIDFISKRLAPAIIANDGKQTPTKGHPVFPAQHACACCCRGCLKKWHHIPQGVQLNEQQINYIVDLLMAWIREQYDNFQPKVPRKKEQQPRQLTLF